MIGNRAQLFLNFLSPTWKPQLARDRGLTGEQLRVLREQGTVLVLARLYERLLRMREELLPKTTALAGCRKTLAGRVAIVKSGTNRK